MRDDEGDDPVRPVRYGALPSGHGRMEIENLRKPERVGRREGKRGGGKGKGGKEREREREEGESRGHVS